MSVRAQRFAATLLVTASCAVSNAWGQSQARSLLRQGVEARQRGRDDDALALFRQAYAQEQSANALAQIGLAEQALGRWVDAERHLREALASTEDRWIQRNRASLQSAYATVLRRVGRLEIHSNVRGAEVRVNGQHAGALPLSEPLRVAAGTITLEVLADGYYPESRRVEVTPSTLSRETVELRRRLDGSAGTAENAAENRRSTVRGAVLLATGLALGAAGTVVGFWPVQSLADGGDHDLYVASVATEYALFALGATGVGLGIWQLASRHRGTSNRFSLAVSPVGNGAAAVVTGRFP